MEHSNDNIYALDYVCFTEPHDHIAMFMMFGQKFAVGTTRVGSIYAKAGLSMPTRYYEISFNKKFDYDYFRLLFSKDILVKL